MFPCQSPEDWRGKISRASDFFFFSIFLSLSRVGRRAILAHFLRDNFGYEVVRGPTEFEANLRSQTRIFLFFFPQLLENEKKKRIKWRKSAETLESCAHRKKWNLIPPGASNEEDRGAKRTKFQRRHKEREEVWEGRRRKIPRS